MGDARNVTEGGIAQPELNSPEVGPVYACGFGEFLL